MDVASLGLRIENGQFVQGVKQADAAVQGLSQTTDTSRAKFDAWQKQIANATAQQRAVENAKALNTEINNSTSLLNQLIGVTDRHDSAAIAGLQELAQQQRAWAQAVGASGEQLTKITAAENSLAAVVDEVTRAQQQQIAVARTSETVWLRRKQAAEDAARVINAAIDSEATATRRLQGVMQAQAHAEDAARTRARGLLEAEARAVNTAIDAKAVAQVRSRALMEVEARAMDAAFTRRKGLMEADAYAMDAGRSATQKAAVSSSQFRSVLSTLTSELAGLNPAVGRLTGLLGTFALGSGLMAGILAGLAAVGYAYSKLTEESRIFKKATDELVTSLVKQKQALFDATAAGREAMSVRTLNAEMQAEAALKAFDASGPGLPQVRARLLREYQEAQSAADQNNANIEKERLGKWWEFRQMIDEQSDKRVEERKKKIAEADAAARKADADAMERLKRMVDAIKNSPLFTFSPGAGVSAAIESRLAYEDFAKEAGARNAALPPTMIPLTPQEKINTDAFFKLLWPPAKVAGEEISKFGKVVNSSAQIIGQSLEYLLVGKLGGGGLGGSFGAGLGKAAASGASVFGSKVFGEAIFGPLLAGAGAAIGNFVGGLLDGGAAARAHAKALREAQKALSASLDQDRVSAGTLSALQASINQIHRDFDAKRETAGAAYPLPFGASSIADLTSKLSQLGVSAAQVRRILDEARIAEAARAPILAEINALEAARVAELQEQLKIQRQQFKEDLQVRLLRAQGKDAAADALALQLQQQREYAEAEKALRDDVNKAAILALLQQVHAAEVLKKAMDALNTTVRNAPSGFKIESYINRFAAARPWEPPLGMPYSPGRPSMPYPKGGITSGGTTVNIGTVSLSLPNVTTPEKVGPAFMTYIRKVQLQTVGPNAPLADAMEYAS